MMIKAYHIASVVSNYFGIKCNDLKLHPTRKKIVAHHAFNTYMYLLRHNLQYTFQAIADIAGVSQHTTKRRLEDYQPGSDVHNIQLILNSYKNEQRTSAKWQPIFRRSSKVNQVADTAEGHER